jgi:chromosome segregation ATPase
MVCTKQIPRKWIGPEKVPRYEFAPREEGASITDSKPSQDAEIERLTNELIEVTRGRCMDANQIKKLQTQNENLQSQLQLSTMMHQSCEHTLIGAIEQRNEAWEQVDYANWHIHELGDYVRNLEEFVAELDGEIQRFNNLMTPAYQQAAAAEDLGMVDNDVEEEEDPNEGNEDVMDSDLDVWDARRVEWLVV